MCLKKGMQRILACMIIITLIAIVAVPAGAAPVEPAGVEVDLLPGDSVDVDKTVTTPDYPPVLDLLLLEDETGSFYDDILTMQGTPPDYLDGKAAEIWDGIAGEVADFQGGVAGFRDFAQSPWGYSGDWVYRLLQDLTSVKATWLGGVGELSASGGDDWPEAQLAALKSGADGMAWDSNGDGDVTDPEDTPSGSNPAWRTGATHVIMLVTDAPCHDSEIETMYPGPTYADTITELNDADVHVIILAAPGAGDYSGLATATGGSVQTISSDSSDIVQATLDALEEITTDVWWVVNESPAPEISVTFDREVEENVAGGEIVYFTETITADPCAPAGEYYGTFDFFANTYPDEGTLLGTQEITVTVLPIPVYVDIKPGSCPNAFNTKQKGVTPVAIAGTEDFDVTTIDPASVRLNGVPPLRWSYDDVTTPYQGTDECGCWEEGPDGFMDLVLHFDSVEFAETLSGAPVKGDPVQVVVSGSNECGASIEGFDCVWVVK